MTTIVVFVLVYVGMIVGGVPGLKLDRTGVALLGAIVLVATGTIEMPHATRAIDVPTLALLFGLMVVSAQLRLGGFYTRVTRWLVELPLRPSHLVAVLIVTSGGLSAIFSNDIVCLAMAPILITATARRGLDPVPFLLALACAANVGSAATLIGNPQHMLIGQTLQLSFTRFMLVSAPVAILGLAATWAVIVWQSHGRWHAVSGARALEPGEPPPFDSWQTAKGLAVAFALMVGYVATSWPRELLTLAGAGFLMLSRRLHSRTKLGLVDWQLLVLFIGLFVVNDALTLTGLPARAVETLSTHGVDVARPALLIPLTVVLSNLMSNVPAVMLLLPLAGDEWTGTALGIASTLAGNLLIVGSIANIIVVEAAATQGVFIDWRRHARTGIPVTLMTLTIAALILAAVS